MDFFNIFEFDGEVKIEPCRPSERRKVLYADIEGKVTYYSKRRPSARSVDRYSVAVMRHAGSIGIKPRDIRLFR